MKPVIKVVQIHNPVYVQTDAINFPSLVQQLTGMKTRVLQPAALSTPADRRCNGGSEDDLDSRSQASQPDDVFRWRSTSDAASPSLLQKLAGMNTRVPAALSTPAGRGCNSGSAEDFDSRSQASQPDDFFRWLSTADTASPSLLQKLAGMNTRVPAVLATSPAARRRFSADDLDRGRSHASQHDDILCWRSNVDAASPDAILDWRSRGRSCAPQRAERCSSGCGNSAETACSPDNSSASSEGYEYEDHSDREYSYEDTFHNISLGRGQTFSERDIWAGLASDHALPDITMLPPLLL